MKKALVILFVACSFAANAQNAFLPRVGFVLSYNTGSINLSNAKMGAGLMAGLAYNMPMSAHLSFQPEVYYVQKSFSLDFSNHESYIQNQVVYRTDASYHDKYRADYIEIPLLFKYKFAKGKWFAILGPYISAGVSGPHTYSYSTTYSSTTTTTVNSSGSDNILYGSAPSGSNSHRVLDRKADFGFLPGIGYTYKGFQAEVRFGLGLVDVWRARDSRNESMMFIVSYPFSFRPAEE